MRYEACVSLTPAVLLRLTRNPCYPNADMTETASSHSSIIRPVTTKCKHSAVRCLSLCVYLFLLTIPLSNWHNIKLVGERDACRIFIRAATVRRNSHQDRLLLIVNITDCFNYFKRVFSVFILKLNALLLLQSEHVFFISWEGLSHFVILHEH